MQVLPRTHYTTQRARELRKGENLAEAILWNALKARNLAGHKFVRQLPVGPYFIDFAHRQTKLAIEVDGSQHSESDHDVIRDRFLLTQGWRVLRFWNKDVVKQREAVCLAILAVLAGEKLENSIDVSFKGPSPVRLRSPPLPHAGEEYL